MQCELNDEFAGAMTPANLGWILGGGVLRIVNQKIGAFDEFSMALVLSRKLSFTRNSARVRLVIATIHNRRTICLDAVPKRQRGMVHILGCDPDIIDIESALEQIMIAYGGAELVGRYRKIGVLHLPRECFAQRLIQPFRSIDVPFVSGREEGREKRNTLDMIPMGMTDENVSGQAPGPARHQVEPQTVKPSPAIYNNKRSALRAKLKAWRVSAMARCRRSGLGQRTLRTPKLNLHRALRTMACALSSYRFRCFV